MKAKQLLSLQDVQHPIILKWLRLYILLLPSFVIVISPISSTNILSNPEGPNVFFTIFAIAKIAVTIYNNNYHLMYVHLILNLVRLIFQLKDFSAYDI